MRGGVAQCATGSSLSLPSESGEPHSPQSMRSLSGVQPACIWEINMDLWTPEMTQLVTGG